MEEAQNPDLDGVSRAFDLSSGRRAPQLVDAQNVTQSTDPLQDGWAHADFRIFDAVFTVQKGDTKEIYLPDLSRQPVRVLRSGLKIDNFGNGGTGITDVTYFVQDGQDDSDRFILGGAEVEEGNVRRFQEFVASENGSLAQDWRTWKSRGGDPLASLPLGGNLVPVLRVRNNQTDSGASADIRVQAIYTEVAPNLKPPQ
jgi:hypothetical protein